MYGRGTIKCRLHGMYVQASHVQTVNDKMQVSWGALCIPVVSDKMRCFNIMCVDMASNVEIDEARDQKRETNEATIAEFKGWYLRAAMFMFLVLHSCHFYGTHDSYTYVKKLKV